MPSVNNYNNNISINRYNIRANIDVNLTKTTKAAVKVYTLLDRSNTPAASTSNLFDQIMRANPVDFPAYYDKSIDNTWYYAEHVLYGNNVGSVRYPNPYAEMMVGYSDAFSYTGNSIFTIEQDLKMITEGLSARGLASFTSTGSNTNTRSMTPFYYALKTEVSELGTKYSLDQVQEGTDRLSNPSQSLSTSSSYYFEVAVQYNRDFGKHGVSGMLVGQMKEQLLGNQGGAFGSLPIRTLGLSGRFTYSFGERYYLEANFGYNGSEKFDRNHRWGFFPSIGLGYIISNEKFWENSALKKLFPMFKFKASYGLVGNDNIMSTSQRFYYLADVNTSNSGQGYAWGQDFDVTYNGYSINRYANSNIGWEAAKMQNYGIEMDFLHKATIQVEYFREDREDGQCSPGHGCHCRHLCQHGQDQQARYRRLLRHQLEHHSEMVVADPFQLHLHDQQVHPWRRPDLSRALAQPFRLQPEPAMGLRGRAPFHRPERCGKQSTPGSGGRSHLYGR